MENVTIVERQGRETVTAENKKKKMKSTTSYGQNNFVLCTIINKTLEPIEEIKKKVGFADNIKFKT